MDLKEQLKQTIKEYGNELSAQFSDGLIDRIAEHMEERYKLKGLNQSELDDFLDSDAIGEAVSFFWNDYLNEE
ncbi:gp616 [Bacillus phage G]|uniref:Gp616 n=1 Tax=Bacillus phage G TaxID=2884420 RepID=G3MAZ6_9CAUD|nr:gp616 [Bacillus phage G]AEO93861.1 gp616 [Bacillus phage G]